MAVPPTPGLTWAQVRTIKDNTRRRLGLAPWVYTTSRREEETTAGIAAALAVPDAATALTIQAAVLTNSPAALRRRWATQRLLPRAISAPHAPDLVLVDGNHACAVVVEHKRTARANATSARTVRRSTRFADTAAQRYQLTGSDVPHPHPVGYAVNGCPDGCGWHTQRAGRDARQTRAGLSQADAYRYFTAWLGSAATAGPLTLADTSQVAWVLLDERGRSAALALLDPDSVGDWHTVGYATFIPAVEAALSSAPAPSRQPVLDLLRMLCS